MTAEVLAHCLREVRTAYDELNLSLFKGVLRRPVLAFVERAHKLGEWCSDGRSLELSEQLLIEQGWGGMIEVLKHEMAHQYVYEVLHQTDEGPHGKTFRAVCEARGIDGNPAGVPVGKGHHPEQAKRIDQLTKLLRLAASCDVHEAAAAASAAQRLMLKYNLSETQLGHAAARYAHRHLGQPTGRVTEAERILACILGEHFFVQVIWVSVYRPFEGRRGRVLEVCGTEDNLELACYVHAYLSAAAERLWSEYRATHRIHSNAHRREFLAGVFTGVRDQLKKDQKQREKEGLVWVGDAELAQYFKRRHPHIRWLRGQSRQRPEAWGKGRDAGRSLDLHRPLREAQSKGPKLLPAKGTLG
jgi:predicted SprT family Zn-dependent metalloprotease